MTDCLSLSLSFSLSGLKVEGVYRRCGLTTKVSRLVEALITSPKSTPLESDEQGVLDAGSALKQYIRQQDSLFPDREREQWLHAAGKCTASFKDTNTAVLLLWYCSITTVNYSSTNTSVV